jgi:hypothetical protein
MKRTMSLFIDKKNYLLLMMDFLNQEIWTSHLIKTSQNEKNYINSHSNFFIGTQYIM